MVGRIGVIRIILASLSLTACRSSALTPRERSTLTHLLRCEECSAADFDAVKNLAASKPAVVDTLSEDLLRGPSPEQRSRVRRQFLETYREDSLFQDSLPPADVRRSEHELPLPAVVERSDEFVEHYLGNYVALYRVRAASALARIGGDKPRAALDSALAGHLRSPGDTLRSDVRRAIQLARDRAFAPTR